MPYNESSSIISSPGREIPDEGPLHAMSASSMTASGFLAQGSK
jgi:hypothetical protein